MIPYDDLVAALAAWRVRKGLPVATGAATRPTPTPPPEPAKPEVRGRTAPPAAPQPRAASPQPGSGPTSGPQAAPKGAAAPPPLAAPDEVEFDEAAMLDEQVYENEGADFALNFGAEDGATAVGQAPQRDSLTTDPVGAPPTARRTKRDEDW